MIRKILNGLLALLFVCCMASTFLAGRAHELLGVSFFASVIAHNVLNRRFYRSKMTPKLACIIGFALSLSALLISGAAMSTQLFGWFRADPDFNWRALHLGAAVASMFFLLCHLMLHSSKGRRVSIALTLLLTVGGVFGLPYLDRWYRQVNVERSEPVGGEKVDLGSRVLTIYFSRVGNTEFDPKVDAVSGASIMREGERLIGNAEMISLMVQDCVGGDLIELQTLEKYPASYSETTKVGKSEIVSLASPPLKPLGVELDEYETIVPVYPLWWSTLPRTVAGFLESNALDGKTLIPIVTHGGGGIGESLDVIKRSTRARVLDDCLDIYSSDIPSSRQTIADHFKRIRAR